MTAGSGEVGGEPEMATYTVEGIEEKSLRKYKVAMQRLGLGSIRLP